MNKSEDDNILPKRPIPKYKKTPRSSPEELDTIRVLHDARPTWADILKDMTEEKRLCDEANEAYDRAYEQKHGEKPWWSR